MKSPNIFQTILLIIFGFFLIIGTLIFAGILPGFRAQPGGQAGQITLWGTIPETEMGAFVESFNKVHEEDFTLLYSYQNPATFESVLVDALARGEGPDLIMASQITLSNQADKLLTIPYSNYSLRQFQDNFIRGAELFLQPDGFLALPLYVDPLVLYYNRNLITNAKLIRPPQTWDDFPVAVKALVSADLRDNISQAAVAMGQFSNITHAKDILTMLILQAGNPIVVSSEQGWRATLNDSFGYSQLPASEALAFFGRFSDPANALYSWNSAQPEAREAFLRGQLAMYFGYASEYSRLREQNPQLNIDVTLIPQRSGSNSLTLGRFTGLALVKKTVSNQVKITGAARAASSLSSSSFNRSLADLADLPPARLDLLSSPPSADPIQTVFYQSALLARSWPDPNPSGTNTVFRTLFERSQIGRVPLVEALNQAQRELELLINPI